MSHLRLVEPAPFSCWPWDLRGCGDLKEHPRGGRCRLCGIDVAVDRQRDVRGATCLYCAMDEGLIEAIDFPLYGDG